MMGFILNVWFWWQRSKKKTNVDFRCDEAFRALGNFSYNSNLSSNTNCNNKWLIRIYVIKRKQLDLLTEVDRMALWGKRVSSSSLKREIITLASNAAVGYPGIQSSYTCLFRCSTINLRVFPILYWISLVSRFRWIQLESVRHDWRILEVFLCLPFTLGSVL